MTSQTATPDYDVAIVGGGISGIYTGWRLLGADLSTSSSLRPWAAARAGQLKVGVFEGSRRIGGRLLSAQPPGMPNTLCEIGGMRYVSSQVHIRSLIENVLNLRGPEQVVDEPQNLAFLRGAYLRNAQMNTTSLLPYRLDWNESQWLSNSTSAAAGLIAWSLTKILPQIATLSGTALEQFLQSAVLDGMPLYHHGFWNILSRVMSSEAYQLCRTMVGYDCLGNNGNAVDLTICYFDFTPDVKYYLVKDGYESVPWQLEQRFRDKGGDVVLGRWLDGFDATTFDDKSTGFALRFHGEDRPVTARSVVLAMPRAALESLRPEGAVLDPEKAPGFRAMLQAVQPIPLYKLFIGYPYPWWTQAGVSVGRSRTDLPVRQCYYWAENATLQGGARNTNAMVMVYDDAANVDFWGGLRGSLLRGRTRIPGHQDAVQFFARKATAHAATAVSTQPFADRLRANWNDHQAPAAMVEEAHRQLMLMHNARFAPEPTEAAFMDWSEQPFGAGVHLWNRGYKSWVIVNEMTQPVADLACYVCGEAYSTSQTWAEGALETAEIVLQQRFGLAAPSWLTANPPPAGTVTT